PSGRTPFASPLFFRGPCTMAKSKTKAKTKAKPKPAKKLPAVIPAGEAVQLALSQLMASPRNPRKTFEAEALADLAESIANQGLLQNLTVRPLEANGSGNGQTTL